MTPNIDMYFGFFITRGAGGTAFDIVSAYPTRVLTDDAMTLHAAGLTPNAVAHLKKKKL